MSAAIDALAPHLLVRGAGEGLGLPRRSLYRQRRGKAAATAASRPTPARALRGEERQQVRDLLKRERLADPSPDEIDGTRLDEAVYHCSSRTL
jgi:hypothetical protein